MENVRFIELVFENVESMLIPMERVQKLDFGELKVAPPDYHGSLRENAFVSDYTTLEITYQSDDELQYDHAQEAYPIGMFSNNPMSNNIADRPHILGRVLQHQDIVYIELCDEQEHVLQKVFVPWSDHQYSNEFMHIEAKDGVIRIHIEAFKN